MSQKHTNFAPETIEKHAQKVHIKQNNDHFNNVRILK